MPENTTVTIDITTCRLTRQGERPYQKLPKNCSFLVSVGKERFQGNNLSSALALINAEFESCTVIVTGTLQRFNLATERGLPPDDQQVYQAALKNEDDFINTAEELIDRLHRITKNKCKFNFVRWDVLRNSEGFEKNLEKVKLLLKTDEDLQKAMSETVKEFYEKHLEEIKAKNLDADTYKENSVGFLTEEMATMYDKVWHGKVVYPTGGSLVLRAMADHIDKELSLNGDKTSWQPLRFVEKKGVDPNLITPDNKKEFYDTAILQKPLEKKIEQKPSTVFFDKKMSVNVPPIVRQCKLAAKQLKINMELLVQEKNIDSTFLLSLSPLLKDIEGQIKYLRKNSADLESLLITPS